MRTAFSPQAIGAALLLQAAFAMPVSAGVLTVNDAVQTNALAATVTSERLETLVNTYSSWNTATNSVVQQVVQLAPTATSAGFAELHRIDTTTVTLTNALYDYDWYGQTLTTSGGSAGSWVTLSYTLTSTIDTQVTGYLQLAGSFTPTTGPFGDSSVTLPALSVNQGGGWASANYTTYNTYGTSFDGGTSDALKLQANVAASLSWAVYVGATGVDLTGISVGFYSTDYNPRTTSQLLSTTVTDSITGTVALAPVPEPHAAWLMLAGLSAMGLVYSRRRPMSTAR